MRRLHRRSNLDHALRDFQLDVESRVLLAREPEEIGCRPREIAVAPVDELELQLHPQSEWLRRLKVERVAHAVPRVGSPARRNASSVSTGPRIAMNRTIPALT